MQQAWNNLLFAHWPLAPAIMRPLVPRCLDLDTFDGQCWVAVTPFVITDLAVRGVPPLPVFSHFPELNVRTYVRYQDKPGVFFFSLDAGSASAVFAARLFYALPYFYARMRAQVTPGKVRYRCHRTQAGRTAEFRAEYGAISPPHPAQPGTLPYFLCERCCLYAVEGRRLYRAEIHHPPWPLQDAAAEIAVNTMAQAAGITLPGEPACLHFAQRVEVLVWWPERLL